MKRTIKDLHMRIGVDLGGTNMRVGLIDGATLVNKVIEPFTYAPHAAIIGASLL